MNILWITEFFPNSRDKVFSGGVETRSFFVAKHLCENNHLTIITRRLRNQKEVERSRNLKVIRVGPELENTVANSSSLFSRIVFQWNAYKTGVIQEADIVEGSNFVTYLPAFFIGKKLKIPKIAWYPDVFKNKWIKLFGILVGLFGEIVEGITLSLKWNEIIAISKSTAFKLEKAKVKTQLDIIPCGIEKEEFKKTFKKFEHPTILVISRLVKYKKIDMIIDAVSLLKSKYEDLKLIIVGEGPEEESLIVKVKGLKLEKTVDFKKRLDRRKILEFLGRSHVLCLPSSQEGFGIVIMEASASNTPYVAAGIKAVTEVTREGLGGILFKESDTEDLYNSLYKLLSFKALYKSKQEEGKRLIRDYYWEWIAKQTENVYLKSIENYS